MPEVTDDSAQYSLYWTWNSAGMSCHAALEELGVTYNLQYIEFDEPWPEDYLAINPHHKVPTLIDHHSGDTEQLGAPLVVYQSAAILLYLADKHADVGLVPAVGSTDRAACYQWLFFLAETLQPAYMMYFYPQRHTLDVNGYEAIQQNAIALIDELWGRLNTQIGNNEFLLGTTMSVCDLFLLPMAWWSRDGSEFNTLSAYPNVLNLLNRLYRRQAVQNMIASHCQQSF